MSTLDLPPWFCKPAKLLLKSIKIQSNVVRILRKSQRSQVMECTLDLLRICYACSMARLTIYYGFTMDLFWIYYGFHMDLLYLY